MKTKHDYPTWNDDIGETKPLSNRDVTGEKTHVILANLLHIPMQELERDIKAYKINTNAFQLIFTVKSDSVIPYVNR